MRPAMAFLAAVLAVVALPHGPAAAGQPEALVRDIAVFEAETGVIRPHQDLLVENTRIAAVQPAGTITAGAKYVIDGRGKVAVPGLFLPEARLAGLSEHAAGRLLATGVTSAWAADMNPADVRRWQSNLNRGRFYGPRAVGAGPSPVRFPPSMARRDDDANVQALVARLMAIGGLTPAAALQAVTIRAAEQTGMGLTTGSLTAGKSADIVILSADPLADVRHLERIDTLIFRGEVLTRAHLNILIDGRLKPGQAPVPAGGR